MDLTEDVLKDTDLHKCSSKYKNTQVVKVLLVNSYY